LPSRKRESPGTKEVAFEDLLDGQARFGEVPQERAGVDTIPALTVGGHAA